MKFIIKFRNAVDEHNFFTNLFMARKAKERKVKGVIIPLSEEEIANLAREAVLKGFQDKVA